MEIDMKRAIIFLAIAQIIASQTVLTQGPCEAPPSCFSVSVHPTGIALKPTGGFLFLSRGAAAQYEFAGHVVSLRYFDATEYQILTPSYPKESLRDVSVLIGFVKRESSALSSFSAGIGVVRGIAKGEFKNHAYAGDSSQWFRRIIADYYEEKTVSALGLALEGQYFWVPSKNVGVGLYGFANINKEASFVGVLFSFRVSLSAGE